MKKLMKIVLIEGAATVSFHKGEQLIVDATAYENSRDPADRALYYSAIAINDQQAHIAHLKNKIDKLEQARKLDSRIIHDTLVGMQSAVIDAKHYGPERGMTWIESGLDGPDMLPDESDANYHDAQAYYDYHCYDAVMARNGMTPEGKACEDS